MGKSCDEEASLLPFREENKKRSRKKRIRDEEVYSPGGKDLC